MVEKGANSMATTTDSLSGAAPIGESPSQVAGIGSEPINSGGIPGSDGSIPDSIDVDGDETSSQKRKKKLTSPMWQHFERKKIGNEVKAICNYCGSELKGDSGSGTRHLHDHFNKYCAKRKTKDPKQMWINYAKKKNVDNEKVGLSNADPMVVRGKIARMIVLHGFPLSVVDYVGFREVCSELNPTFKMVSRNTMRSDIVGMFSDVKGTVKRMLATSNSRISITTDMWTSSSQQKGYMAITAHFIDESWTLRSLILRFAYVPSPHTAEVLTEVLSEYFFNWNVDRKILAVTVDNCTTNDAMISNLLNKLDLNALLLRGRLIHMRCSAHILNLIVKDGLDIIAVAIQKVRDSVVFWTASPKRLQRFKEAADQLNIRYEKQLNVDCKTRWNSTYLMLSVALLYKDVFKRLKLRESLYQTLPSDEDWKLADEICEKLSYFYDVTKLFSGSRYPTVHLFFNDMCEIRMQLGKWIDDPNRVISDMAKKMLKKFSSYWSTIHGIMAVGVFLDPRYKLETMNCFYNMMPGVAYSDEYRRIRSCINDMMCQYKKELDERKPKNDTVGSDASTVNKDSIDSHRSKKQKLFMPSVMKAKAAEPTSSATLDSVRIEYQNYVDSACLPDQPLDILGWWRTAGSSFPILQAMARDILAVPVSTVASESSFSTSGNVLSKNRSRLKPDFVEALMCGQSWLWSQIRDESPGNNENKMEVPPCIEDEEEDVEGDSVMTEK